MLISLEREPRTERRGDFFFSPSSSLSFGFAASAGGAKRGSESNLDNLAADFLFATSPFPPRSTTPLILFVLFRENLFLVV